ncbi:hypothetical protein [Vibrio alginolyticus]|uniref:hypothetical protein n=1 Tax=Vibrio alginolyticus TaxID=663 RepID=UPI00211A7C4B|nr:hypothetical protein [Vibrio alginolyticus]MCQ9087351.1 hypothetical protein [Vibrio alginolyticus]
MSELKKFELYVECTGVNGHQVFACEAENEQAAKRMLRNGQCAIIDEQLEVTDLAHRPFNIEESDDISSRLSSDVEHSLESKIKQLEHDKACLAELLQKMLDTEGIINAPHNRKVVKSVLEKYS